MNVTKGKLTILVMSFVFIFFASTVSAVFADSTPVNFIGVNFAPITSSTASNYDFSAGTMSTSTATATVYSTTHLLESSVQSDPPSSTPNGFGTFIGTAHPERFGGDTVVYTQSACPTGYPACLSDGSFTYGYFVMYNERGATLNQLTNLATMYYLQNGCFGGGSPRFSIIMSDGSEIFVYLGTYPAFIDCVQGSWQSTGNLATDAAGLRWDTSQICPSTFYNTYSGAVMCANINGLTISAIFLSTDGGWSGANPATTQTILFKQIQVNGVTRFP